MHERLPELKTDIVLSSYAMRPKIEGYMFYRLTWRYSLLDPLAISVTFENSSPLITWTFARALAEDVYRPEEDRVVSEAHDVSFSAPYADPDNPRNAFVIMGLGHGAGQSYYYLPSQQLHEFLEEAQELASEEYATELMRYMVESWVERFDEGDC